jgi:hypothetical protein
MNGAERMRRLTGSNSGATSPRACASSFYGRRAQRFHSRRHLIGQQDARARWVLAHDLQQALAVWFQHHQLTRFAGFESVDRHG